MGEKRISSFKDLYAWQEGHRLVLMIYEVTKTFPNEEMFGLTNQMRRATVSITSNIAEGFGRQGYKEKVQFYHLAKGSLNEIKNQIMIAGDVGYLSVEKCRSIMTQADATDKILQGLIAKSKSFLLNHS